MSRSDPIRKRYYEAVEKADRASDLLFYLGAALSLALLLIDKATHLVAYDWTLIAFALATAAFFGIGLVSRFYWVPRTEDKRRQDFFTSACDVGLTHEQTDGYEPPRLLRRLPRLRRWSHHEEVTEVFPRACPARCAHGV